MGEDARASQAVAAHGGSGQKEWLTPKLRKLPIAATSGGALFNEGVGKGKGDSGSIAIS
jgi:hypothetical protein